MQVTGELHDPAALLPSKNSVPIEQEAMWPPEPCWIFMRTWKSFSPARIQRPKRPSCSLVAIITMLFRLDFKYRKTMIILFNLCSRMCKQETFYVPEKFPWYLNRIFCFINFRLQFVDVWLPVASWQYMYGSLPTASFTVRQYSRYTIPFIHSVVCLTTGP
jgi:hypothetical protein